MAGRVSPDCLGRGLGREGLDQFPFEVVPNLE